MLEFIVRFFEELRKPKEVKERERKQRQWEKRWEANYFKNPNLIR